MLKGLFELIWVAMDLRWDSKIGFYFLFRFSSLLINFCSLTLSTNSLRVAIVLLSS